MQWLAVCRNAAPRRRANSSPPIASGAQRILRDWYRIVSVALGILLLTAAAMKGHQLATAPTAETNLLTNRWFLIGLVEFQLVFGLWIFGGLFPRQTRLAAIVCFAGFACVSLYLGFSGAELCHCFGDAPMNPWLIAVMDLCAVTALWLGRPRADAFSTNFKAGAGRAAIVAVASLIIGIPAASSMARFRPGGVAADGGFSGDPGATVLDPPTWVGKQFPLVQQIDIGGEFARGEWSLLFYHHDCPQCRRAIARLDSVPEATSSTAAMRTALVEIPPFGPLPDYAAKGFLIAKLNADRQWFMTSPVEVVLAEGCVVGVRNASEITAEIESSR